MMTYVEEIGPFSMAGHSIKAFVRSHGVSSAGPAIPSNAQWIVEIDGSTQIGAGLEARYDDTETFVKPYIESAVKEFLEKEQAP